MSKLYSHSKAKKNNKCIYSYLSQTITKTRCIIKFNISMKTYKGFYNYLMSLKKSIHSKVDN